jgi:hypothetical protein
MPLSMSFLAVPLARLVWNAERANADGVTIDELLYPHSQPAPLVCPAATPEDVVRPLLQMAGDCPLTEVGPALEEVLDDGGAWARLAVLTEALDAAPGQHMVLREALVLWATSEFRPNTPRRCGPPSGWPPPTCGCCNGCCRAGSTQVMPERHAHPRSLQTSRCRCCAAGQLAADAALRRALSRPVAKANGARLHRAGAADWRG